MAASSPAQGAGHGRTTGPDGEQMFAHERSGEPDPHLVFLENVLMVGGGVPIRAGDEIVGAIGVSGSPGSVHDEECADAGILAIKASLV